MLRTVTAMFAVLGLGLATSAARAEVVGFRAPAGGTYYVDVEGVLCPQCGDLARYAVSLKAR